MNHKIKIPTPKEFDFAECLRFLARSEKESLHIIKDQSLWKLIETSDQPILVEIFQEQKDELVIYFPQRKISKTHQKIVKEYVVDWLDLKSDLSVFYKVANKDAILRPLAKQFYGLRLIGIPNFFEALSWAIIGQQINLNFAYTLKGRLIEKFGSSVEWENEKYFLFPEPATIAQLTVADLRVLQFSQRKAEYLIGLAQKIEEGVLSKTALSKMTFEEAKTFLVTIRGIGNWTANYVIMKCLRHPDAFPLEDVGLHNALKKQLGLDQKPSLEKIKKLAGSWEGWRAYATFYLWQSLLET